MGKCVTLFPRSGKGVRLIFTHGFIHPEAEKGTLLISAEVNGRFNSEAQRRAVAHN
jgi:hypothetical protein